MTKTLKQYKQYSNKKQMIIFVFFIMLIVVSLLALMVGSLNITLKDILGIFFNQIDNMKKMAILNIRLPRILAAILVGSALASSGCVMQCVVKNPLASSSTLGVSQGAAFGAALAIVLFNGGIVNSSSSTTPFTINNPYIVTIFAFIFGSFSTLVVVIIARMKKEIGPSGLILSGVALTSLFQGGSTILQYFCDDTKLGTIVFWTFGNLANINWQELLILSIVLIFSLFYFILNSWNYNAIESSYDTSNSLGINSHMVMVISMLVCSLVTSCAVSFVGIISFIGLVAPHIMRKFIGNDHRYLILGSAICGSILLVLADILSRVIIAPIVLPIGALTSFLGAPIFLFLLVKGVKKYG